MNTVCFTTVSVKQHHISLTLRGWERRHLERRWESRSHRWEPSGEEPRWVLRLLYRDQTPEERSHDSQATTVKRRMAEWCLNWTFRSDLQERHYAISSDGLKQTGGAGETLKPRPTAGEERTNHDHPRRRPRQSADHQVPFHWVSKPKMMCRVWTQTNTHSIPKPSELA